jgi:type I restriction enzyme S subunit
MNKQVTTKPFYNSTIPSDWEVKSLGELCEIYVGRDLKENNYSSICNAKYRFPVYSNTVENEGLYGYYDIEEYSGESLTIVGRGAGLGTAFTRNGRFGAIGRLLILFPKENVSAHYITEFVNNKLNIHQESGGIPQLTGEQIAGYKISIPKFSEQIAIAHILILMDTVIHKNNSLIAKKELQKKWLMQNLLTGKKRLKGFEKEKWKAIKLGDVCEFIKSYSISREGLIKSNKENSVYCIHYGDIHAFYETEFLDFSIQQNIPQIIDETYITNERDYLKDGDIIMADASEDYEGVGEVVEVTNLENKIAIGGLHTVVLRCNPDLIVNGFKGYLFASEAIRNELRKMATGSSVYSVTKTTLHNLLLLIPNSLKEQTAIAKVVHAADKEIQLLKTKTEKLREQKKGMIQVLLTGKKRLTLN